MVGPHKKEIEWDKVELYLKAGATQAKIAESLCIDRNTLSDRVEEKYGMKYAAFAASLHRTGELLLEAKQFQKAMEGNTHMLTWLGKIRLGQTEVKEELPRNDELMSFRHENMLLRAEIAEMREKLNAVTTSES